MKLLVFGHFSHTGFGTVTVELCTRFVQAGIDVRIIAVNHRGEPVQGPLAGRVWPANIMGDGYGSNISDAAIAGTLWRRFDRGDDWKPDLVLAITDTGGLFSHLPPQGITDAWKSVPVFHYCPIEGDNLDIGWRGVWDIFHPVAMSDYGQRVISEHIGKPVPRIYHGVNTDDFHPVSMNDPIRIDDERTVRTKEACKRLFKLDPERKHIVRTDRNATRKFYYRLLEAFVPIARADPLVDLVLHCVPVDPEGVNLIQEIGRMPEDLRDRVKFTQAHDSWRGLTTEGLVALLNAGDIYVSTTGGEGFGLTLAEALACEVPVVVTDWAAEREVVGPGGLFVPPTIDSRGQPVRYHSVHGMDWAFPDALGFVEPVLELLRKPSKRRELGAAGRRHVMRSFSWDTAAAEFLALFGGAVLEEAA